MLTSLKAWWDSLTDFQQVLVWAFGCLVWTLFFPGAVAYRNRVFYASQLRCVAHGFIANYQPSLRWTSGSEPCPSDTTSQDHPTKPALEQAAAASSQGRQVPPLIESFAVEECALQWPNPPPPAALNWCHAHSTAPKVNFLGFLESNTTYPFTAATFALGIHAFWIRRRARDPSRTGVLDQSRPRSWRTRLRLIAMSLALWGTWFTPNIMRTFLLGLNGRHVFSFVNADIDAYSFALHELRALGICSLLACSWYEWATMQSYAEGCELAWKDSQFNLETLHKHAVLVGEWFDEWQTHSFLLAIGFLPWTIYYWSIGPRLGDQRYYVSTLIWHAAWGVTWWGMSRPVLVLIHAMNCYRARFECSLLTQLGAKSTSQEEPGSRPEEAEPPATEAILNHVRGASPVSSSRVVLVAAGALITFIVPIVKAFA